MSNGTARGFNPKQPKIFGRENINYKGPDKASTSDVDGTFSTVSQDFTAHTENQDTYKRMITVSGRDMYVIGQSVSSLGADVNWSDNDPKEFFFIGMYDENSDDNVLLNNHDICEKIADYSYGDPSDLIVHRNDINTVMDIIENEMSRHH